MKASQLARLFITDVLGMNLIALIKGKKIDVPVFARPRPTPAWVSLAYYVIAAGLFTLTGAWDIFLLYWLLPMATLLLVLVRWGAICEHKYNMPQAGLEESTPIIMLRW